MREIKSLSALTTLKEKDRFVSGGENFKVIRKRKSGRITIKNLATKQKYSLNLRGLYDVANSDRN